MNHFEQQELNLFPEKTFEQLLVAKNVKNLLSVQKNSRLKRGWNVTINKFSGRRLLTIPNSLQSAPERVKTALIHWALLPFPRSKKNKNATATQRRELEKYIHLYLHESGILKPAGTKIKREHLDLKTQGLKYDLKIVFNTINETYFNNNIQSYVRWGNKGSTTSYQTSRTSPDGVQWNLITIAGVYNHPQVPQYALESVMYHEMLHIAIPPYQKNGRNIIHGKEFKATERKFPHFTQWQQWEKKEIRKLARELRLHKK